MKRRSLLLGWVTCSVPGMARPEAADEALWSLLNEGGQVVLIRHAATEPGLGDPPGMRLQDCKTQRNLSEEGRREAVRLGHALRERGVVVAQLLSSPWCRCRETARLAFEREPEIHAALGNLFGRPERAASQVAQLRQLIRRPERGNLVMVTHGSTTSALAGVSPGVGEMVIVTPQPGGGFSVAGRLAP